MLKKYFEKMVKNRLSSINPIRQEKIC